MTFYFIIFLSLTPSIGKLVCNSICFISIHNKRNIRMSLNFLQLRFLHCNCRLHLYHSPLNVPLNTLSGLYHSPLTVPLNTLSGRIGKVVDVEGCKVARSNPGCGSATPIYTMHEALRGYCPMGGRVRPVNWIYRL